MNRSITVKGVGKAAVKPDLIELNMNIAARREEYQHTMNAAAKQLRELQAALQDAGFEQKDLKTLNFGIDAEYIDQVDKQKRHTRVFAGYVCSHQLRLAFGYDIKRLGEALAALSRCPDPPEFSIRFTVSDTDAVGAELLKNAAVNARAKALILAEAAGVRLGSLLSIDHSWSELNIYSPSRYQGDYLMAANTMGRMEIEPEDIKASDTVTFVWEIGE